MTKSKKRLLLGFVALTLALLISGGTAATVLLVKKTDKDETSEFLVTEMEQIESQFSIRDTTITSSAFADAFLRTNQDQKLSFLRERLVDFTYELPENTEIIYLEVTINLDSLIMPIILQKNGISSEPKDVTINGFATNPAS